MTDVSKEIASNESSATVQVLREFWYYFSENRGAVIGLGVVLTVIFVAIFADVVAPHEPFEQYRDNLLQPPVWEVGGSWTFPLGTDATGRDMLSRIMHGARFSLIIGCIVITLSLSTGILLGLLSAFSHRLVDIVIMRMMDVILAVPSLLLALVIVAIVRAVVFFMRFAPRARRGNRHHGKRRRSRSSKRSPQVAAPLAIQQAVAANIEAEKPKRRRRGRRRRSFFDIFRSA